MQDGIMIDDILITNDTNIAREIAKLQIMKRDFQREYYDRVSQLSLLSLFKHEDLIDSTRLDAIQQIAKEQREWDEMITRYSYFFQQNITYLAVILGTLLGVLVALIFFTQPSKKTSPSSPSSSPSSDPKIDPKADPKAEAEEKKKQ